MAKKPKVFNLERQIVVALRKIFRYSPQRKQCIQSAKIGKNNFKCPLCKKEGLRQIYIQADHTDPVGKEPRWNDEEARWVPSWDCYILRMICPVSNLQALCLDCHEAKTNDEKAKRTNKLLPH